MNLLIAFFFFIFTIQDTLAVPKIIKLLEGTQIENSNTLIESIGSTKWMARNSTKYKPNILTEFIDSPENDFATIWYNMYVANKLQWKPEKYMMSCKEEEEYINLCGECVGGTTEKDDNFGLDNCGVCYGLQRCSNECKESSIETIEEEESDCMQILGMKPNVVDVNGSSAKTTVQIIATELKIKDITCSALFGNNDMGNVEAEEKEWGLVLHFEKAKNEGKIELFCNTSEGVEFRHEMLAVDSSKLKPISTDKHFLEYGKESKIMMRVTNLYALTDLVCFGKQDGQIVYKYWTNDIQGNSLSSEVYCEGIWPTGPSDMEFGLAYTESSMDTAQTIKISVFAPDPKVIKTKHKGNQISIVFDRNIPTTLNCNNLKGQPPIGKGATCEIAANEFRINLGQDSKIKKGQHLTISLSNTKAYTTILDDLKVDEKSIIAGPSKVCRDETVKYKLTGDESAANWSIAYTNKFLGQASPGSLQRMNLLLWRNIREKRSQWDNTKQISINTSLLMQDTEYELKALSRNSNGDLMKFSKSITVSKHKSPLVYIQGVNKVDSRTDIMFEAQIICQEKENLMVMWKTGENKELLQEGSKLYIKASDQNNKLRSIIVELLNKDKIVYQDKISVKFEMDEFNPPTYIDQIVVGTGHNIEIPINNHGERKFLWQCFTELGKECRTAGKDPKPIETVGTIDDSLLFIPRGMLPVGRYAIEIKKTMNGTSSAKIVQLRVIFGEPPFLSLKNIKIDTNIKVNLRISDVIGSCEVSVGTLMANNYTYIDLKEIFSPEKVEGTPLNPINKDYSFKLPEKILKFGAKYKFRFSVNCGALSQSYIIFSVPLKEPVKTGDLEVTPLMGSALITLFKLNVKHMAEENTIYDYGYIFKDTYYYLEKKLDPSAAIYLLPGQVKPFVKVCQIGKICRTVTGSEINVHGETIDPVATKNVLDSYKTAIKSGFHEFAVGNAKTLTESSKPNEETYRNITTVMNQILHETIDKMGLLLQKDISKVNDALDLLQSSMKIVDMMETSDESREKIITFRDKIQAAFKKKTDNLVQSAVMKVEPRAKRQVEREPKKISDKKTIEVLLEASIWDIQKLNNKTEMLKQKETIINRLPDDLSQLCNAVTSTPLQMNSTIKLRAVKLNKNTIRQYTDCGSDCKVGQSTLPKNLFKKNNYTDGVCLGEIFLPYNFSSDLWNNSSETHMVRASGVYINKVFRYTGDIVIKDTENITGRSTIFLWPEIPPDEANSTKCFSWANTTGWTSLCKTLKLIMVENRIARECNCPLQGIYALFKLNSQIETTGSPNIAVNLTVVPTIEAEKETTTMTTVNPPAKPKAVTVNTIPHTETVQTVASNKLNITTEMVTTIVAPTLTPLHMTTLRENVTYIATFTINENFNKTIGYKKTEFENKIKQQLVENVKLSNETDLEVNNENDNIKITLKLLSEDAKVPSAMIKLADTLLKGELQLKGLDNKDLRISGQKIELYRGNVQTSSSSSFIIVISCGVFILIICVVAVLLSGVFLKWRRELRAMNFLQSMETYSRPKYLRLHESSSLDAMERSFSDQASQQRPGELDSGIVLTVDPNKISSKYQSINNMTTSA
ncbi:uncharacterized protein LOC106666104 [Cimex lectularius]|uniref:PKD/REJ-like domain-containing protein n=1 Tax=Cimex lectularius TaxID=79782 RepID=A0A8I6RP27_CIMLE|nr:uncharacterized protein LOC106666104 [Cimex lectularius]